MTCAVIYIKIDSVKKSAITIIAINTEREFKSEYLFRMCSVVTNLVTSQEFKPIRRATVLCHFGRTQIGNVATRFVLFSSTAESRATSGHVVLPERFGQSEARAGRNVERTRKKLSFVPSSGFNWCSRYFIDAVGTCEQELYLSFMCTLFNVFHLFSLHFFLISPSGKPVWSFVYVIIYYIGAGMTILMSISDGLDPYFFRQRMEKTRSMKEEMDGEVFVSHQSWHFSFIDSIIKVLSPICTLNWRVNNYVSC